MRLLYVLMAVAVGLGLLTLYFQGALAALGWIFAALCLLIALSKVREARGARRRLAEARREQAQRSLAAAAAGGGGSAADPLAGGLAREGGRADA